MTDRSSTMKAVAAGSRVDRNGTARRRPILPGRTRWHWFSLLCLTLAGYALFGKGWAYLGFPPIFLGEVGAAGWPGVAGPVRPRACGLRHAPRLVLAGPGGMGPGPDSALRLGEHGIDALRDAAVWGYSAFRAGRVRVPAGRTQAADGRLEGVSPVRPGLPPGHPGGLVDPPVLLRSRSPPGRGRTWPSSMPRGATSSSTWRGS